MPGQLTECDDAIRDAIREWIEGDDRKAFTDATPWRDLFPHFNDDGLAFTTLCMAMESRFPVPADNLIEDGSGDFLAAQTVGDLVAAFRKQLLERNAVTPLAK